MRQDLELTSFTKGELSPRLRGRTDYEGYFNGCETLLNMVVMLQGGTTRRPGTLYSAHAKFQDDYPENPNTKAKLIAFQFSVTQAYMLEFGHGYMRVYRDRFPVVDEFAILNVTDNGSGAVRITVASTAGLENGNTATISGTGGLSGADGTWVIANVTATTFDLVGSTWGGAYISGGTASIQIEIATPWTGEQVFELGHTQSADVLYLTHPEHKTRTISRTSHTNWTIAEFNTVDGPYMDRTEGQGMLTLNALTGATSITFASTLGVNKGVGLTPNDLGRLLRFSGTSEWCWMIIDSVTSPTVGSATILGPVTNGAAGAADSLGPSDQWQLGAWYPHNWPWLVSFFQQRLFFAATNSQPSRIDGSAVNDFTSFAPSMSDGTVIDSNAVSWVIYDDQVNAARWMVSSGSARTPQLAIGNDAAEQVIQAGGSAQALTPTSVQAFRETHIGSRAYSRALRVNKSVIFASFGGRKLYEWAFNWQSDGYLGGDKSVESEHLTRTGLDDIAYQKRPYSIIWAIRADGNLVGMTYLPEQQVQGWHQHRLGGNYFDGPPVVESIACMPATDATYDELWLVVKRTINGVVARTVEVMDRYFDRTDQPQDHAIFMDSALQSDLIYPLGILVADATTLSDGLSQTTITFTVTAGTPFTSASVNSIIRYNGGTAMVTGYVSSTVVTGIWFRSPINLKPAVQNFWSLTPQHASFSGLDHLEGEAVQILGDGADFGVETVTAGAVTLEPSRGQASFAIVGLPIRYRLVSMPWAPRQAADSQGHYKAINMLWLRLYESLGCDFGRKQTDEYTGRESDETDALPTRNTLDVLGAPPPLQSGIYRLPMPGGHDQEGQIVVTGQGPYPTTVLAILASSDVGELPGGA